MCINNNKFAEKPRFYYNNSRSKAWQTKICQETNDFILLLTPSTTKENKCQKEHFNQKRDKPRKNMAS